MIQERRSLKRKEKIKPEIKRFSGGKLQSHLPPGQIFKRPHVGTAFLISGGVAGPHPAAELLLTHALSGRSQPDEASICSAAFPTRARRSPSPPTVPAHHRDRRRGSISRFRYLICASVAAVPVISGAGWSCGSAAVHSNSQHVKD